MKLTLLPQRGLPGQLETEISVLGDVLIFGIEVYDFSSIPEGGTFSPEVFPFIGDVSRKEGVIECTFVVQLGQTAESAQGGPWVIEGASGVIEVPAIRKTELGFSKPSA